MGWGGRAGTSGWGARLLPAIRRGLLLQAPRAMCCKWPVPRPGPRPLTHRRRALPQRAPLDAWEDVPQKVRVVVRRPLLHLLRLDFEGVAVFHPLDVALQHVVREQLHGCWLLGPGRAAGEALLGSGVEGWEAAEGVFSCNERQAHACAGGPGDGIVGGPYGKQQANCSGRKGPIGAPAHTRCLLCLPPSTRT